MNSARRKAMGMNTQRWRKLRRAVLARDRHTCVLQLPGCLRRATQVHIAPILQGDHRKATMDTSIAVCAPCHGRIDGPRAGKRFFSPRRLIPARSQNPAAMMETDTATATPNRFLGAVGRVRRPTTTNGG